MKRSEDDTVTIFEALKTAEHQSTDAALKLRAANDELAAARAELAAAERSYATSPTDALWRNVEAARARIDRATVVARQLAPVAESAERQRAELAAAIDAERARAEREKLVVAVRAELQKRHDELNGAGFVDPFRKIRRGMTLFFEGVNEVHRVFADLQRLRLEMARAASSVGLPLPNWEPLPDWSEFTMELKTIVAEVGFRRRPFDLVEFSRMFDTPPGVIPSPRQMIVNARKRAAQEAS